MSEFVVYRTLGNGRCLVLDDTRIAGGKPDYRGNNYITSWVTNETYGPVDELKSENAKLREEVVDLRKSLQTCENENSKLIEFASAMYRSILLVPDDHIPAETKARYFEVAVSLGLDVPDD